MKRTFVFFCDITRFGKYVIAVAAVDIVQKVQLLFDELLATYKCTLKTYFVPKPTVIPCLDYKTYTQKLSQEPFSSRGIVTQLYFMKNL